MRKTRRFIVLALAVLTALCGATAVWAQGSTGGISGKVVDAQNQAIPGAEVVVTSKYLQGPRGTATNLEGEFSIPYLPPGQDYKLIAESQGYGKVIQSNVTVSLGSTTTLTITLAGTTEMTVTAKPPAIMMKDTKVTTNLTQEELETLPIDRSYQSVLYLAPSVVTSGLGGNPTVSGASGNENIFLLNGLNTTDPVTGTFGTNLNYNFIREMEVGHGGYEAEFGASTGGLFNVLPKSGTNEFHGEVFFYYESDKFAAKSRSTYFTRSVSSPSHSYDYGFDLGGPIVKDRLWFFAGYNPTLFSRTTEGSLTTRYIWDPAAYPNNPYAQDYVFPYKYDSLSRNYFWSVKLTYRMTDKHNFDFFVTSDPSHMWFNEGYFPSLYGTYNQMSRRYQGGWNAGLKWFATWSNKFFQEVLIGDTHSRLDILPWEGGANGYGTPLIVNLDYTSPVAMTPGFGSFNWDDRDTTQFAIKWTYLAGKHELKWGGALEYGTWKQYADYTGGFYSQAYRFRGGSLQDIGNYGVKYVYTNRDPGTEEKSRYLAVYGQDKWSLTDYLTLSYGARWEQNQIKAGNGNKLELPYLAPRLGFTWDWAKNGKSKLYGSYGEYSNRLPIALSTSMDSGHNNITKVYRSYGYPTPQKIIYAIVPTKLLAGTKAQFDREWVVGAEYEVMPDLTMGARLVYRELGRLLEDVGWMDDDGNINYIIGNPGIYSAGMQNVVSSFYKSSSLGWQIAPFSKPVRRYKALELVANKRFSNRWFMNANYTLSRSEGNTAGGYDQTIGQLNPSASMDYDIPSGYGLHNRHGLLPGDRTHNLKVQGSYRWDWGLVAGMVLQVQSGRPKNKIADWPFNVDGYGVEFVTERGSAGRLPTTWYLDLHAEYAWKIAWSQLSVFADVFNVTNNQKTTSIYQNYFLPRDTFQVTDATNKAAGLLTDPYWGKETGHQAPRGARIGVKWSF